MNRPKRVAGLTVADVADRIGGRVAAAPAGSVRVTGVSLDSRRVQSGDLYAALPGATVHGASFAAQACSDGAVAVLTDPAGEQIIARDTDPWAATVPVIVADDPRSVLGRVSADVYGRPSERMHLVGVTGTNGKTTTAYLVESAWRALGYVTGLVGTIETLVAGQSLRSVHTTPESPDLQGLLALMAEKRVGHVVMEVSSHALALHRSDSVAFDTAVFTNLSQDHLDFHGTMESYFEAKAMLFTPEYAQRGVVCVDDQWGRRLAALSGIPVITLATPAWREPERHDHDQPEHNQPAPDQHEPDQHEGPPAGAADYRLVPDESETGGFALVREGRAQGPERLELRSALPGAHNQINTALAALVLLGSGLEAEQVRHALSVRPTVPGRMEYVHLGSSAAEPEGSPDAPLAVVDFAHTPDAIEATLSALAPLAAGRGGPLVAVLGAGGNRDHGKRPLMGSVAARLADVVVVTDDNPRLEDPVLIRAAVAEGARATAQGREGEVTVHEVEGRAQAVAVALEAAGPSGVVAVLGKGHELTQIIGTTVHPFDDRAVLAEAWSSLSGAARGEQSDITSREGR